MYKYASDVAVLHDIRETSLRLQHQRQMPKQFDGAIVMETTGTRNAVDSRKDFLKFVFTFLCWML